VKCQGAFREEDAMHVPVARSSEEMSSSMGVDSPLVSVVTDAAVLSLCNYDALMKVVDFNKVKTILKREVDRVGAGPMHLTPLFVYLHAIARPMFATDDAVECTRAIAKALEARAVRCRLPDALRFGPLAQEGTRGARTSQGRHEPMGTRASRGRSRTPTPQLRR
jgi:hypothetical protein